MRMLCSNEGKELENVVYLKKWACAQAIKYIKNEMM